MVEERFVLTLVTTAFNLRTTIGCLMGSGALPFQRTALTLLTGKDLMNNLINKPVKPKFKCTFCEKRDIPLAAKDADNPFSAAICLDCAKDAVASLKELARKTRANR